MRLGTDIRRVVVVVLDGLRPDAIDHFDLVHTRRLMTAGASTRNATTVAPSVTTAAMTSLMTGVSPAKHGITGDRLFIPKVASQLTPLPELLTRHGYPTAAFMGDVPLVFRGLAATIGKRLGFGTVRMAGKSAPEILMAARSTLRAQRRGLILFHWPDADQAGHSNGWMSQAYGAGAMRMDGCLGMLAALADDPHTVVIGLADHGGGGIVSNDHESDHPLDRTIPMFLHGARVARGELIDARLVDVPATIAAALGVEIPRSYEGRVLTEAFAPAPEATPATAVA